MYVCKYVASVGLTVNTLETTIEFSWKFIPDNMIFVLCCDIHNPLHSKYFWKIPFFLPFFFKLVSWFNLLSELHGDGIIVPFHLFAMISPLLLESPTLPFLIVLGWEKNLPGWEKYKHLTLGMVCSRSGNSIRVLRNSWSIYEVLFQLLSWVNWALKHQKMVMVDAGTDG